MPNHSGGLFYGKHDYFGNTAGWQAVNAVNWGGKRPGAGRPVSTEPKRSQRAIKYFDNEWELIKAKAARRGMSVRAYLYFLVEQDTG